MNVLLSKRHHKLKTIHQQQQFDETKNLFHTLKPITIRPSKKEQPIKKKNQKIKALESRRLSTNIFSYPTDHFQCWVHPVLSKTPEQLFQNKLINGRKDLFENKFQSIQQIKNQILAKSQKMREKCVTEPVTQSHTPQKQKYLKFNIRSLSKPKNRVYSNVVFQFKGKQFQTRRPLYSQAKLTNNK